MIHIRDGLLDPVCIVISSCECLDTQLTDAIAGNSGLIATQPNEVWEKVEPTAIVLARVMAKDVVVFSVVERQVLSVLVELSSRVCCGCMILVALPKGKVARKLSEGEDDI